MREYVLRDRDDGDEEQPMVLRLREDPDGKEGWGVGATVWDAGMVLAKCLEKKISKWSLSDIARCGRVIELGSGTGVVGLVFAAAVSRRLRTLLQLGPSSSSTLSPTATATATAATTAATAETAALGTSDEHKGSSPLVHVVLTDKPALLPLLQQNIAANTSLLHPSVSITCAALDWTKAAEKLPELAKSVSGSWNADGRDGLDGPSTSSSSPFQHRFDLILASDVAYHADVYDALVNTLVEISVCGRAGGMREGSDAPSSSNVSTTSASLPSSSSSPFSTLSSSESSTVSSASSTSASSISSKNHEVQAYLSYERRENLDPVDFFRQLGAHYFFRPVPTAEQDEVFQSEDIYLFSCQPRTSK